MKINQEGDWLKVVDKLKRGLPLDEASAEFESYFEQSERKKIHKHVSLGQRKAVEMKRNGK